MFGQVRANVGHRARLGFMVLATNTVLEDWLPRARADGVSHHVTRMAMLAGTGRSALDALSDEHIASARMLSLCEPDVIAYACTALTFIGGRAFDLDFMQRMSDAVGVPCLTTTEALLRALDSIGARRLCIASPYSAEVDRQQADFFASCGHTIVNSAGFGITDYRELGEPSPGEIYRLGRQAYADGADALVITCLALRSHDAAAALEADLGIPVITSSTALMWASLRQAGVRAKIGGFGRLLE